MGDWSDQESGHLQSAPSVASQGPAAEALPALTMLQMPEKAVPAPCQSGPEAAVQ